MTVAASHQDQSFLHEAFFYESPEDFMRGTLSFIREGLEAGEPVLVVLNAEKIAQLRQALGVHAVAVLFADMAEVGANPARIIAAWQSFVEKYGADGQPIRGIGEPIWAGRSGPALAECHRHESLLNVAFADAAGFRLLCPYDVSALADTVLAEAHRTHPFVSDVDSLRESTTYRGLEAIRAPFAEPLASHPEDAEEIEFDRDSLAGVRSLVGARAASAGMSPATVNSLVLAVNEVATNSIRHGGGRGIMRLWRDGGFLVCQIEDAGRIEEPLVGRQRPVPEKPDGRGLWLANQLCDLVQLRTFDTGSAVRIHMALGEK